MAGQLCPALFTVLMSVSLQKASKRKCKVWVAILLMSLLLVLPALHESIV